MKLQSSESKDQNLLRNSRNLHRYLAFGRGPSALRAALDSLRGSKSVVSPVMRAEAKQKVPLLGEPAASHRLPKIPDFSSKRTESACRIADKQLSELRIVNELAHPVYELPSAARSLDTEEIVTQLRNSFFFELLASLEESR